MEIDLSSKLVFSTSSGDQRKNQASAGKQQNSGPLKMRLETNGRGGKAVTVLFNLPFTDDVAKEHMRSLQSQLGCGGSFKNSTIEIRGDMREKIEKYFSALSIKIVRAGG
jgi:translation initiation factor 1